MELASTEDTTKALSRLMRTASLYEPKVNHYFSDGVCVREMEAKAGSIIVGAEHKTNHLTILLKGTMQIRIGNESKLLHAPHTFEALAGSRKIGLAYTDCLVSNIIPTDCTNIEEIEKMFTTLHEDKEVTKCLSQQ